MKILHTSDWHIGKSLYGRKRYDEFSAFLDWLAGFITAEKVDALLVAGDIFDTSMPSNRAQELYYRFLSRVASSCCRHVVVIAGNHDSSSFINAPQQILRALNVHVVGSISEDLEDEVIILKNKSNVTEAIVCAVPYLRDRDIRTAEAGESVDDKGKKLIEGLKMHYANVCKIADEKRKAVGEIPLVGMGHLFTAGGKTVDGDGVSELYIGSLAHVKRDVFPSCLDYLALGHLHVPQKVSDAEHIRYSGSPIPMGFGEARQEKKVVLVDFDAHSPLIQEHTIPVFQTLERVSGSMDGIFQRITELKLQSSNAWLEIEYTESEVVGNLSGYMDAAVSDSDMETLLIKNKQIVERVITQNHNEETLDDLDVHDVFMRCLDGFEVNENQRPALIESYKEIIISLNEEDTNEE